MAYVKQNFETGQTLTADMLNHMEDGIYANSIVSSTSGSQWQNLAGKRISILGDSISTFTGYSYSGNRCRYPQSNLLTDVNLTYWKKLIDATGMILGVSETWAGSRVSWDGSSESGDIGANKHIASVTRISHLGEKGNPDIILVYAGTNDAGAGVSIGTLNTSTSPKGLTEEDIKALPVKTFSDAFRTMILRLQFYYPKAKIVVLNLAYSSTYFSFSTLQTYSNVIENCCKILGVDCIDLRKCGMNPITIASYLPDGIHPNAEGMELMFRQIYSHFMGMSLPVTSSSPTPPPSTCTITYKYVDETGTSIKTQETSSVTKGSSITINISTAPSISGYIIQSVSPNGVLSVTSDMTITYSYVKESSSTSVCKITYKYVDMSGNTLKADTTQSYISGTNITPNIKSAPSIDGYTVHSVSPSDSFTISEDTIITYIYKEIVYRTITYTYTDTEGAIIKDSTTQNVIDGTTVSFDVSNAPVIPGYKALSVSPAGSAPITADITVVYTYDVDEYTWYLDHASQLTSSDKPANLANGGWMVYSDEMSLLQNVPINTVRFYPSASGVLNFYKRDNSTYAHTLIASITISSTDVGSDPVTYVFDSITTLSSNESFVIGEANSQGGFRFKISGGQGFYSKVKAGSSALTQNNGLLLGISVGYTR